MEPLSSQILVYAHGQWPGSVISAKALLHLGSRNAVDQTLSRLAARGRLVRLARGQYQVPSRPPVSARRRGRRRAPTAVPPSARPHAASPADA